MVTPIYKGILDYSGERPLDNAETLKKIAQGVEDNLDFSDSPKDEIQLRVIAQATIDTHEDAKEGNDEQKVAFKTANKVMLTTMHEMGVYSNYKCNGLETMYVKLHMPYYDASKSGKTSSVFSLTNGPAEGELLMTVPINGSRESTVVMYALEADALIGDYKLAGGNSNCRFSLTGLPVGVKIYVIYATIGSIGVSAFSVPYPIIVT
jgi:hypothetical protein